VQRFALIFVILGGLALAGTIGWRLYDRIPQEPPPVLGGPFELIDQNGRKVDEDVLEGKWSAVFFGFTYCPDVCPLTLQALTEARELLGPKGKNLRIVFISVDPGRDTPKQMKAYLGAQDLPPGTLGLTGTPEQVAQVAQAYRVYYGVSGDPESDTYTVNHSTAAYLMDPKGRYDRVLGYGMTPEQMAEQITDAMN